MTPVRALSLALLLAASSATAGSALRRAEVPAEALAAAIPADPARRVAIQLDRSRYRAGDTIWFKVWDLDPRDLSGGPDARRVTVELIAPQGQVVSRKLLKIEGGTATNDFQLSERVLRGVWTLRAVTGEGVERTLAVPVGDAEAPLLTAAPVALTLHPEGGALVEGLESRVFFAATDARGGPVDVSGRVLDDTGAVVATLESAHDGMGRFDLTPKPGRRYHVALDAPVGGEGRYGLPEASAEGCVLRTRDDPEGEHEALRVRVWCARRQSVVVVGTVRGHALGAASGVAGPRVPAVLDLLPDDPALTRLQGVARLTVLGDDLAPLAERLVYRNLGRDLDIQVEVDRTDGVLALRITTRDPDGVPVPAELALSVVDEAAAADAAPSNLLASLYLEPELAGAVHKPAFYVDAGEPDRALAMALWMGIQGPRSAAVVRWSPPDPTGPPDSVASAGEATAPVTSPAVDGMLRAEGVRASSSPLAPIGAGCTFDDDDPIPQEPAGRVVSGPPTVVGSLDSAAVRSVVERELGRVGGCYERALQQTPDLGGELVVRFVIPSDGRVRYATPGDSTLGEQTLEQCASSGFQGMRFPKPPDGGAVMVSCPLLFMPGGTGGWQPGSGVPYLPPAHRTFDGEVGPLASFSPVRAFPLRPEGRPGTALWVPQVITDARGEARVELRLLDTRGRYRVVVEGVGAGLAGHAELEVTPELAAPAPP
ncbi:MAG: AgmX/PglI C-terminal domain-containing protein [Alphaproteobacteria bacterium]|nr:AgmX/PglI C-terminal domain-containing protein [Alphaproteobacteria bacterium]